MSSEKRDNDFFLSDPRLFVPAVPWLGLPAPLSDCDSERPAPDSGCMLSRRFVDAPPGGRGPPSLLFLIAIGGKFCQLLSSASVVIM